MPRDRVGRSPAARPAGVSTRGSIPGAAGSAGRSGGGGVSVMAGFQPALGVSTAEVAAGASAVDTGADAVASTD